MASGPRPAYARALGLFSATMAVIGGIIGSGIFVGPAVVAQRVGTPGLTLAAWGLGGLIALAGALCFAELGERAPRAGGGYVYLRDAFGPLPAFLYGWALLLVIATGACAFVAVAFANYTVALLGLPAGGVTPLALAAIALVTAINYVGVRPAAITQNVFVLLKLAALALLIVAGLFAAPATAVDRPLPPLTAPVGMVETVTAMGAALVPVLFTYGGWQQTNFIAEELIEPKRTLPRALVLGVVAVIVVYVCANVAYVRALTVEGLAASTAPAADAMRRLLGPVGARLIAAGIAASSLGFLDLVVLVTPRVFQAMAADGVFFARIARLHPAYGTPGAAILLMGAWASVLALTGTYGPLLDYVTFADWIFFGLAAATLFTYRARDRAAGKDAGPVLRFRTPGFPVVPALFILAALYVVASSVLSNPGNAMIGTGLLLLGIPVYRFWRRRRTGRGDRGDR